MSEPAAQTAALLRTTPADSSGGPVGTHATIFPSIPWTATWLLLLSFSAVFSAILVMALHSDRGFFVQALAAGVCILAALFDAWTTRIPNPLTYTAILAGLALNAAGSGFLSAAASHGTLFLTLTHLLGAAGLPQSLLGFGVCAGLGIFGMVIAKVGGGDIKLLAALGALLGISDISSVLLVALGVAALYALFNLAFFGRLNLFSRIVAMRILEIIYLRRIPAFSEESSDRPRRDMVPMAVPLAIGLILAQVFDVTARMGMVGGVHR